jgi:quercetin dioxygenase-like cupin family protein
VLGAYHLAPPLDAIRIPFEFHAPDGQSVIDRRLVPEHAQGVVAVSVLLDEANTGNPAASMLDVRMAAGSTTARRTAARDQLWYVTAGAATVGANALGPGDMVFVPKGAEFDVAAPGGEVHAVVVLVPGGHEGTARAGALPNPLADGSTPSAPHGGTPSAPHGAIILHAKNAKTWCRDGATDPATCAGVQIVAEPSTIHATALSASRVHVRDVPAHQHDRETELIYVESGSGTLAVGTTDVAITETSVVQLPAGVRHAFHGELTGLQIYTPAGPEQRFKR